MNDAEKQNVLEHARTAHYSEGVMQNTTEYCGMVFRRFMNNGNVLELGPAEGIMTDLLYPFFHDYTVVDGADFFIETIKKRHPGIKGYVSLFEEFTPNQKYENIVLGHVLEHVENPMEILKHCSQWLTKTGRILAAVPNANSIHRQAAVLMGMLESKYQLNDTDRKNGHRRVYDLSSLRQDFSDAGLKIFASGGYWLKPESNGQINSYWTQEMINAFCILGESYPDIAGEIYVVAIT